MKVTKAGEYLVVIEAEKDERIPMYIAIAEAFGVSRSQARRLIKQGAIKKIR